MREVEGVCIFEEEFSVQAMDFHVGEFGDIEGGGLLEGRAVGSEDGHGDGHELCDECWYFFEGFFGRQGKRFERLQGRHLLFQPNVLPSLNLSHHKVDPFPSQTRLLPFSCCHFLNPSHLMRILDPLNDDLSKAKHCY